MAFFQSPPAPPHPYTGDRLLRGYLERTVPSDVLAALEPDFEALGDLAIGPLHEEMQRGRLDEPRLVQWDPWGHRIDRIELTPLWQMAQTLAAQHGLVASGYEREFGAASRLIQFTRVLLLDAATAFYSCPLAMTDGAAKTLLVSGNRDLIARAVPRLTSRDPARMWTSGQWMTERTGGSDVAITETLARPDGAHHRLHGTKWFTSATTSEMALTLARPEGNPPGGAGLALFYVETRDERGAMNGIQVNRLKEKLGTRMVPTAELTLDGALATAVAGTRDGIRNITPMLAVTRTWNAVAALSGMTRAIALARDYATKRVQFGAPLAQKPLHVDTLAGLVAERHAAFVLTFRSIELLGREENGGIPDHEKDLLRLLTPLAKLCTGKQAVAIASETLEAFGGAGYVEDTGLPCLLRDAQVLPIWEGTTNVLSLDVLRALARGGSLRTVANEIERATKDAPDLAREAAIARDAVAHATHWFERRLEQSGGVALESGARRFAMTLARSLALSLLVEHAAIRARSGDRSVAAAARRFASHGIDLVRDDESEDDARLLLE